MPGKPLWAGLFLFLLGSVVAPSFAWSQPLELSVVSHNAIDLRWSFGGVFEPLTQRGIIKRGSTVIWESVTAGQYELRDENLPPGANFTYALILQRKQLGNWVDEQSLDSKSGKTGYIEGAFMVGDMTWDPSYGYEVGGFTVSEGTTLTIPSGTTAIMATNMSYLDVYGTLNAEGTSASPVTLRPRSLRGDWAGVSFFSNSHGLLDYCTINDGGKWFLREYSTVWFDGNSSVTVRNCRFNYCRGVIRSGSTGTCRIENCRFINGQDSAVQILPAGRFPILNGNQASGFQEFNGVDIVVGTTTRAGTIYADLPYQLRWLSVGEGTHLTIEAGARLVGFDGTARMDVYGILTAAGTPSKMITFTPKNSSQGWSSIFCQRNSRSVFQNCRFEDGGRWFQRDSMTFKVMDDGQASFLGCTFDACKNALVFQTTGLCEVSSCTFQDGLERTILVAGSLRIPNFGTNTAQDNAVFDGIVIENGTVQYNNTLSGNLPYRIGTLNVPDGKNLSILEGSRIIFDLETDGINVDGTLMAAGTSDFPIVVEGSPGTQGWGAFAFSGTAQGAFSYVKFLSGGRNPSQDQAAVVFRNTTRGLLDHCSFFTSGNEAAVKILHTASAKIHDCLFSENNHVGLSMRTYGDVQVSYCTFRDQPTGLLMRETALQGHHLTLIGNHWGIDADGGQTRVSTVTDSFFEGNTEWAVYNHEGPEAIDARDSWWGSSSGPTHATNPGGTGQPVTDNVLFNPWQAATPTPTETPSPTPTPTMTGPPLPTDTPTEGPSSTPVPTETSTPYPPGPPQVFIAGYWDTRLQQGRASHLDMLAYVFDNEGPPGVEELEYYYAGQPTGVFLKDDGFNDDKVPGNGIFGFHLLLDGSTPPGRFLLELQAIDIRGETSLLWPYLDVR